MAYESVIPLTIWMNMPSFYQIDLYRDLVRTQAVDLQVIFGQDIEQRRTSLGWRSPLVDVNFPYSILKGRQSIGEAIRLAWRQKDRLHIVNGIWAVPSLSAVLAVLRASNSRYLIYSEGPNPLKKVRPLVSTVKAQYARRIAHQGGILGIAEFSRQFYRQFGFPEKYVYEFGYFEAEPTLHLQRAQTDVVELIFVGQLIHRKGIDLLLQAFANLYRAEPRLRLTLIGDGEQRSEYEAQADDLGVAQAVCFKGIVPSDKIREYIAAACLLVLPSRFDGWGIVANEALSVGVPVVISDMCGAAELIQHEIDGYVFPSEDTNALYECLAHFIAHPEYWEAMRAAALREGERVSSATAAAYLVQCLRHFTGERAEKPTVPWLEKLY